MNTSESEHPVARSEETVAEAGRFFRYMAEYVGFTSADAAIIRQTQPIIAKNLPDIVSDFYIHLLRYPVTRALFLDSDGALNEEYLVLRMRHLSNFWLRAAEGVYDDDFAGYVDYVGRAHTSRGADPNIYVPERYVIGQVGMIQHAISQAVSRELRTQDDELEFRAGEAWDKLMMVLLEMLARAYGHEREPELYGVPVAVDNEWVRSLASQAVELEHGDTAAKPLRRVAVATISEIPDGQRKIIQVETLSIGVFNHQGTWYAVENRCIHQGGPVATGTLEGDILTCPWHGYQYNLRSGICLADPAAELMHYTVTVSEDTIYLDVPENKFLADVSSHTDEPTLAANEFRIADLQAGEMLTLNVNGRTILVYNIDGTFYATDEACTHAQGPLETGILDGKIITCLLHGSCFDVTNGAVVCAPATEPLITYPVAVQAGIGRVTVP